MAIMNHWKSASIGLVGAAALGMAIRAQTGDEGDGTAPPPFSESVAFKAPAPPAPEDVIMLRMRDGSIRWGAIEAHDPAFVDFVRLDNSGRARVPWGMITPIQAETLRTKFGYVDVEAEEALVEGERLTLKGGGTIEGVVVSREGPNFLVKTDGNLQSVPKSRVASVESGVQLPALDVYTREEMYGIYVAESDPTSSASQVDLAHKCEGILAFENAVQHYELALTLGIEDEESKVEGALSRARIKAANQEQVEYLRETERLRKRGQFDRALEMLMAFETTYEDSALLEDARKQQTKLVQARDAATRTLVQRRWKYWAGRLTRLKSKEESFEAARTWAVERAGEEILAKVLVDVQAQVTEAATQEQVRTAWDERKKLRYTATTYGSDGTWLLGADAAQAGGEEAPAARQGPVSEVDAQRQALEQRIKRYLDNQKVAQRGQSASDAEDERQVFWSSWSQSSRARWLFAYHVEQSGDFELRAKPYLRPCRTCAGKGAVELLVTGTVLRGESQDLAQCPLCRGVQVSRRIYYR